MVDQTITSIQPPHILLEEHAEDDSPAAVSYETSYDFADSTNFIRLSVGIGNGADEHMAGELHLFDTASTVYHKNFYARTVYYHEERSSMG